MRNRNREALKRVVDGYVTRDGFFIERCPGNQWNVVTRVGGSYPDDYVSEGARTLAEALRAVDAERA